jgi:hypothetical protein
VLNINKFAKRKILKILNFNDFIIFPVEYVVTENEAYFDMKTLRVEDVEFGKEFGNEGGCLYYEVMGNIYENPELLNE